MKKIFRQLNRLAIGESAIINGYHVRKVRMPDEYIMIVVCSQAYMLNTEMYTEDAAAYIAANS